MLDPYIRLAVSLVAAMALWSPTLARLFRGDIDPLSASLWFTAALALTSAGVVGFDRLVGGYARRIAADGGAADGGAADGGAADGGAADGGAADGGAADGGFPAPGQRRRTDRPPAPERTPAPGNAPAPGATRVEGPPQRAVDGT